MYAIGTRVYVKSLDVVGTVTEANYVGKPRRACYLIEYRLRGVPGLNPSSAPVRDFLTGSKDLRAADYCCDGCGRWLPGSPFAGGAVPGSDEYIGLCFLCAGPPARREELRLMHAHETTTHEED